MPACCHCLCLNHTKTLTFCNISTSIQDIKLKLGIYVHYQRKICVTRAGNSRNISDLVILHTDFLFTIKHLTTELWHAVHLSVFSSAVFKENIKVLP